MSAVKESPSQTAGPYVHIGCCPLTAGLEQRGFGSELGTNQVAQSAKENAITLDLLVLDGAGEPVKDALIEIWQAGPDGSFEGYEGFSNWGRKPTDLQTGKVQFETLKPGKVEQNAPHILVWIAARGINLGLTTRIYFPDEENSSDPVFDLAGERFSSLVAEKTHSGYRHTIHLQGDAETVFFDI